jgi:DNA-binding NarL/FixJ family response regulator
MVFRPSDSRIRVIVVADVRLYREGLAAALTQEHVTVIGTASNRREACLAVQDLQPEVAIIDVAMPEAFDLMGELRTDAPMTRLIAFAVDEDVNAIVKCAEAGASGYVSANAGIDDLVCAIERAVDGELVCSPRVAAELFRRIGDRAGAQQLMPAEGSELTHRERQVLALVRQRLLNKEIAVALNISEATVKNHVHNLLEKLHVRSRAQAAACRLAQGRMSLQSHAR